MATIKVLIEGYAEKRGQAWVASSTVCLITTEAGKKIITDPGCHRQKLLDALRKENVMTEVIVVRHVVVPVAQVVLALVTVVVVQVVFLVR